MWEVVQKLNKGATLSRKEIESGGKGKGPDVMELFRTLQTASFSNF